MPFPAAAVAAPAALPVVVFDGAAVAAGSALADAGEVDPAAGGAAAEAAFGASVVAAAFALAGAAGDEPAAGGAAAEADVPPRLVT